MCEREIERFNGRGRTTGNGYVIVIVEKILDAASMGNPGATIPGLRCVRLEDGTNLNRISQKEFQSAGGEIIDRL